MLLAYLNYSYPLPRWLAHYRTGRYLFETAAAFALVVALTVKALQHFAPPVLPVAYLHSPGIILGTASGTLFVVVFIAMFVALLSGLVRAGS
ncbi:hypothetical protein GCM10027348_39880 [Hymenobacter tenuis]